MNAGDGVFERVFRCYSVTSMEKDGIDCGNKILMPLSALEVLSSLNIGYPMVFEIKNGSNGKKSHCGVLEFTAQEGTVCLPQWGDGVFERVFRCYSVTSMEKDGIDCGNKILMPLSALEVLSSLNIGYPMVFEIKNGSNGKKSHCGVLEFTAQEGTVCLPQWMMDNLEVEAGGTLTMKNVSLPKASGIKIQPHTTKFLEVKNPKEVLESALGKFSCLTMGDTIMITDKDEKYYIDILETDPPDRGAVDIIDTNCNVDFAPPLDYNKPPPLKFTINEVAENHYMNKFVGMGIAKRLDGKPSVLSVAPIAYSHEEEDEHACCDAQKSCNSGQPMKGLAPGFKAFTGKKYILSSEAAQYTQVN